MLHREIYEELANIESEIQKLRDRRKYLQGTLRDGWRPGVKGLNNGADSEYFKAIDLRVYVLKYLEDFSENNRQLAIRAGVSAKTIQRIRNSEDVLIAFKTADKIFTAMGIPKVLDVIPKYPRWVTSPPPSQYYEE